MALIFNSTGQNKFAYPVRVVNPEYIDTTAPEGEGATADDIVEGKVAFVNGEKVIGTSSGPTGTLPITENGIYDVASYAGADVNVSGGGGFEPILTQSIGLIYCSNAVETDLGKSVSVPTDDYGIFFIVAMRDNPANGKHLATVSMVVTDSTTSGSFGNSVNYYLNSDGDVVCSPYNNTTQYGVYAKLASSNMTSVNLNIYARFNSMRTKEINGDYTIRVYQLKTTDILGS